MSSQKKFIKGWCDCSGNHSQYRFKIPSLLQMEATPEPISSPVYGSIYLTEIVPAITSNYVEFDSEGPFNGVTLGTDSITVNSSGVYNIAFSVAPKVEEAGDWVIIFQLSINGELLPSRQLPWAIQGIVDESPVNFNTLSRTDQLKLNQDDVIRIYINVATSGLSYAAATLVVTKVA